MVEQFQSSEGVTEDFTVHVIAQRDGAEADDAIVTVLLQHVGNASFQFTQRLDELETLAGYILDQCYETRLAFGERPNCGF